MTSNTEISLMRGVPNGMAARVKEILDANGGEMTQAEIVEVGGGPLTHLYNVLLLLKRQGALEIKTHGLGTGLITKKYISTAAPSLREVE